MTWADELANAARKYALLYAKSLDIGVALDATRDVLSDCANQYIQSVESEYEVESALLKCGDGTMLIDWSNPKRIKVEVYDAKGLPSAAWWDDK